VLAISSGYVLVSFEHFLDGRFLLALYLPMVVAAGGNTGAQAATSIIRAMSLGEFEPSDYIAAVWKELRVGLCIGITAGLWIALLTPVVIVLLPGTADSISAYQLASIAALALVAQITTSTILGAALPILANTLNQDPAVVASPAITTVVDVTGLFIYFGIAKVILGM
jgi:magnesium transporter